METPKKEADPKGCSIEAIPTQDLLREVLARGEGATISLEFGPKLTQGVSGSYPAPHRIEVPITQTKGEGLETTILAKAESIGVSPLSLRKEARILSQDVGCGCRKRENLIAKKFDGTFCGAGKRSP